MLPPRVLVLLPLLAAFGSGACGGNSLPQGSADGGTPDNGASPTFTISASNARYVARIDRDPPGSGRRFFILTATLQNTGEERPLPVAGPLFTVLTGANLLLQSRAYQSLACPSDISVAIGGQQDCSMAFEVPDGDAPSALLYEETTRRAQTDLTALVATAPDNTAACFSLATNVDWSVCYDCLDYSGYCGAQKQAMGSGSASCWTDLDYVTINCGDLCSPCWYHVAEGCSTVISAFVTCLRTSSCAQKCGY
jgi:hypothetical protein